MNGKETFRLPLLVGAMALLGVVSAAADGPFQFYSVTPCRIVNTRNAAGPVGGPSLSGGAPRNFPIKGYCGVPADAEAATVNVTFIAPTVDGFIKIWPYDSTDPTWANKPRVSTINAAAGEPAVANGAIVPLSSDASLGVSVVYGTQGGGTADLIIDVTGYFK